MDYREWWREFDDIDWRSGEPNFITNDDHAMIEVRYTDGLSIDVGRENSGIYAITVTDGESKEVLCTVNIADREKLHDKLQEIVERFRERAEEIEPEPDENERRAAELVG